MNEIVAIDIDEIGPQKRSLPFLGHPVAELTSFGCTDNGFHIINAAIRPVNNNHGLDVSGAFFYDQGNDRLGMVVRWMNLVTPPTEAQIRSFAGAINEVLRVRQIGNAYVYKHGKGLFGYDVMDIIITDLPKNILELDKMGTVSEMMARVEAIAGRNFAQLQSFVGRHARLENQVTSGNLSFCPENVAFIQEGVAFHEVGGRNS